MTAEQVFRGSDNVFADIGLPNAEEHLIKAQLVYKIDGIMKDRRLKQVEAASLFGVKQPDVSKMLRGDFRQFSVERLMRFLVALGQDVEIVVKPTVSRDPGKGHLSVVMQNASHA
jgi:predicted XRE-type DNA-binding protein